MTLSQFIWHALLPATGMAFTAAVAAGWAIGLGVPL